MLEGTWKANRRPVVTTAPDALVYINGELSLPSGSNPNRRVPIQPLINSININLSVNSVPGSASIDLHVPLHYLDDIFVGNQLTLTTMMEVQIYMKGHFTVGGVPQYYPVFWGITTSVSESFTAGEQTVSLSCQDILYWWQVQQTNINPSWLAAQQDHTARFNFEGNYFTNVNPFSIIYTLSRSVHGDSMNVRNQSVQQFRSEAPPEARRRLMAYWSLRWGRIGSSLKMFGPTGQVLKGDLLRFAVNPKKFLKGKKGSAAAKEGPVYEAFQQGDINFADVSAFSLVLSQLGAVDLWNSEFESKLNLAVQTRDSIGYEFFMDTTGEIIFKPPFYNLDVRPNFPVSWIRDVDVISWNFAENPPEATFVEATGQQFKNLQIGLSEEVSPKATYVDYRLVQKYGWIPGAFSSEFIGSTEDGGPRALFYHLVDILDRQNARVNNGTVTIPCRPEMRLGYPVYIEGKDMYYYVESITHTFSYGSRCTTQLTLMARRQKFYGAFDSWEDEGKEPKEGELANPGDIPQSLYKRDIDPVSGTPVGDRNTILTYFPARELRQVSEAQQQGREAAAGVLNQLTDDEAEVPTFEAAADDKPEEVLTRNLVNLRAQFGVSGPSNYFYQIDPFRDEGYQGTDTGERVSGPITHIEADSVKDVDGKGNEIEVNAAVFPVSDERGYEVVGAYEYGRRAMVDNDRISFDKDENDVSVEGLLFLGPDEERGPTTTPNVDSRKATSPPNAFGVEPSKDKNFLLNPNNYGRALVEVRPPELGATDLTTAARVLTDSEAREQQTKAAGPATATRDPQKQGVRKVSNSAQSKDGRTFRYNSNVGQWRDTIRQVRDELGYSEEAYPDDVIMGFIHVESAGNAAARRTNPNGQLSQFVGLMQIGEDNAADFGRQNTDFQGDGELSIRHFLQYQNQYADRHQGDPRKQAILWKGGPGVLRQYNELEENGATPQELENWLANYPPGKPKDKKWGVDNYASRLEAASSVWNSSLVEPDPSGEVPEDGGVKESAKVVDEADDPVKANLINTTGLPNQESELAVQIERFAEAFEANVQNAVYALPPNIQPPRDPSVLPELNRILKKLYDQAFQTGKTREEELRGINRQIPRLQDIQSLPTETPDEKGFVDTPLSREEIREALDEGQTLQDVLGREGPIEELRDVFEEYNQEVDEARAVIDGDEDDG